MRQFSHHHRDTTSCLKKCTFFYVKIKFRLKSLWSKRLLVGLNDINAATIQKIGENMGVLLESGFWPLLLLGLWCKNHSIFIHHSKCYRSLESRLSQSFFWRGNDIGVVPFVSTHILFPLDTMIDTAHKSIPNVPRKVFKKRSLTLKWPYL